MKKLILITAAVSLINLPYHLLAQEVKPEAREKMQKKEEIELQERSEQDEKVEKKETQEIMIRNNSGKDINLKVEINGDKITVNGKPLAEFKDDGISINNRKMIIRKGDDAMEFNFPPFEGFRGGWKGKDEARPFLGVTTEKVPEGAKITEVIKTSAAAKAGLQKGDIITKIGEEKITGAENLSDVIADKKPKEHVDVSYLRKGKTASVTATLGERKIKSPLAYAYTYPRGKVRPFSMPGIQGPPNGDILNEEVLNNMESLTPDDDVKHYFKLDNSFARQKKVGLKIQDTEEGGNVKVIEVEEGSAAEKAGLKKEDVITEIGGERIENTDDAREQLMPSEEKSAYTIKVMRNGKEMTFTVKFPKKLKTANL